MAGVLVNIPSIIYITHVESWHRYAAFCDMHVLVKIKFLKPLNCSQKSFSLTKVFQPQKFIKKYL